MSQVNNSTCSICGKEYYLCLSCQNHKLTPWKLHTDTSEHYKIYQILHGYTCDIYTKEEARNKLKNVDLSDLETFRESIKDRINDILSNNEQGDLNEIYKSEETNESNKNSKKRASKKPKLSVNSVVVKEV